ncbi:hypothetical protein P170DRAFT_443083 [Aspergillus steynii IBT 23096]|uniref:DnaJ homologue subfamily C member 28 conserved domain-containing protein n=1 Tax=Aspergillus steynii IBT 23096 TaxID=1392250 RepID=A0A2I2GQU3_9EURO|nr:uncharacterized protein P170DRAFT_443083 [Aspergillus steynii IBT 23096]PLB55231.1 hypothetical protein P170DRAFT_443083 [Aspergillus steynii IBT 23096]
MARRLSEMTEQAMLEGGRSARKNMEQAGFSEDLKKELEERIAASAFKSEHATAHSIVDMPESAGQGTRDIAGAQPWGGSENLHDVTLRMLDSSKKPLRTPYKIPQPNPVDMRISPKPKKSPGLRLAEAKERTSTYTLSQSPGVSDHEREAMRKEMRERFTPGARPMPVTIQGLTSLANERIEDAIARGQFDKIKRGKGINTETDHNANNAYIDTTEYFMNKMIQKQELVPPWIEKQQEIAREVGRFRDRLRTEWRRHAARKIASHGGSLEAQMRRAQAYAAAEARLVEKAKTEKSFQDGGGSEASSVELESNLSEISASLAEEDPNASAPETLNTPDTEDASRLPHLPPFRDPEHLAIERSFYELTIKNLNTLTRSYNLQAPPVAQKPYMNLERELSACYADVAPSLAEEIKRRATERARTPESVGSKANGLLDSLSTSPTVNVYEEDQAKGYGFKQFWRDMFSKKD